MRETAPKTILMTGLSGLLGRWTAARLTRDGHHVIAPLRQADARAPALATWLDAHGGNSNRIIWVEADLADPAFASTLEASADLSSVTHIYSFAASMDWYLDPKVARQINMLAVRDLVDIARRSPGFERFVHVSGYLVTSPRHRASIGFDPAREAASPKEPKRALAKLYKRAGAYEASKIEADYLVRRAAYQGLPVTILNPATVIGASDTGEAQHVFGLEGIMSGLADGSFAGIPGTADDWVPLVAVDYCADFAASVPFSETKPFTNYVLLHQGTPTLSNMVAMIGNTLCVKAPTRRVPLWALKALLSAGLEKRLGIPMEGLAFINNYRFDTSSAEAAAAKHGIIQTDIAETLEKTVRYWQAIKSAEKAA